MNIRAIVATVLILVSLAFPFLARTQVSGSQPNGEAVFNARCKSCHDPAVERAPGRAELAVRSRADIVQAMASGVMQPMSNGMSPAEMQAVAAFLSPVQPAVADDASRRRPAMPAVGTDQMCEAHPPIAARDGDWSTLGVGSASDRFQRNPGFNVAD